MEKAAEERLGKASGAILQEERRFRQGAQSFGAECFAWYFEGRRAALVREQEAETIAAALFDGAGCESAGQQGRGELLRFNLEAGHGLVRRHRRGGLARLFLRDSYVLRNRPYRELRVHSILYGRGLPVPEPLGAVWKWTFVLFKGAIATREIPGENLLQRLRANTPGAEDVLRRAGELVRSMHDLGAYHADLQVRNVVVGEDRRLYLIDFDNARLREHVSPMQRARNLLRFRRSLQKNGLPDRCYGLFKEGYGEIRVPRWLDLLYRAKGVFSDLVAGRILRGGRR